jgi:hypothetical protein
MNRKVLVSVFVGVCLGSVLGSAAMFHFMKYLIDDEIANAVHQVAIQTVDTVSPLDREERFLERVSFIPDDAAYPPAPGFIRGYVFLGACSDGKWINRYYDNLPGCETSLSSPVYIKTTYLKLFVHQTSTLSSKRIGALNAYQEVKLLGYEPSGHVNRGFTVWLGEVEVRKRELGKIQ